MNRFWTEEELISRRSGSRLSYVAPPLKKLAYCGPPLTDRMVADAEKIFGVKLPQAFIDLLKDQNGGLLKKARYPCEMPRSWGVPFAEFDWVGGLGYEGGLDSSSGAIFMQTAWEYPKGLLWLSGDGHVGIFLDYRKCGPLGEPAVVYVDVEEPEPLIWPVASSFKEFEEGLIRDET